jgi:hypothetical protein
MPAMRGWVTGLAVCGALLVSGAGCSCSDDRSDDAGARTADAGTTAAPRVRVAEEGVASADAAASQSSAVRPHHRLTGSVRTFDGRALPGAVIRAEPVPVFPHAPESRTPSETTADAAAAFALPSLEAGDWALLVSAEGALRTYAATVRVPERERFDIVLPRGSVIEGTVIDETTRAPVAGARVRLENEAEHWIGDVRTSADGRFVMPLFDETGLGDPFRIDAPGYATEPAGDSATDVPARLLGRHEVTLIAQHGRKLTGRAVGPDGPIAGARVTVRPGGGVDDPSDVRTTTTDTSGRYEFEHLDPDSSFWIYAESAEWVQQDETDPDVAGTAPPTGFRVEPWSEGWTAPDIEMRRRVPIGRCTIRGRVMDEDEHAAAGVQLVTHHRVGAVRATSEGDGSFFLADVPTEAEGGQVEVRCVDGGEWEGSQTVETRTGSAAGDVVIYVSRVVHPHVRGRVLAPDRTPVAGARVVAVASSLHQAHCFAPADAVWIHAFEGRTGADGGFDVELGFTGEDFALVVESAPFAISIRKMPLDDAIGSPFEVVLANPITVTGRVVRAGTEAGVAGLSVYILRPSRSEFVDSNERFPDACVVAATAADGSFRVGQLTDTDMLGVAGPGWIAEDVELVSAPPGPLRVEIRPALEVAGRAQFADGGPCSRVVVSLQDTDPDARGGDEELNPGEYRPKPSWPTVVADSNGAFSISPVAAGRCWLTFTAGSPQVVRRVAGPFDAGTRDLRVDLVRGVTIRGRVVRSDARPVTLVTVTASAEGRDGTSGRVTPNRDGAFAIGGLDAGPHVVEAAAEGCLDWKRTKVRGDGEPLDIRLDAGLAVAGTVRLADGSAAAYFSVEVEPVDAAKPCKTQHGQTDSEGRFRVTALTPGRWRIRCEHARNADVTEVADVVVEAGSESLEIRTHERPKPPPDKPADDAR